MKNRLNYLDSIKGIMSLNVVIHHFVVVFYPTLYFIDINNTSLQQTYAQSPLSVLTNGNIAVMFFFVLSGFLTTFIILKSKNEFDFKMMINRTLKKYKNILFLVFPSVLIAYLLMEFNLMFHLKSIGLGINYEYVSKFNNFLPTLKTAFYDVFIGTFRGGSKYVGPLWTMKWELYGAVSTMIIILISKKSKFRRIIYIFYAILLMLISTSLVPFIFGVFIADVYFYSDPYTTYFSRYYYDIINAKEFIYTILFIGLYLSSIPVEFVGLYSWMAKIPFISTTLIRSIGISLLLYFVLNNNTIQKILSSSKLVWLGGISSYIYILHWPIMLSLEHLIFQKMINYNFSYNFSAMTSLLISVPVILLISHIFKLFYNPQVLLSKQNL